MSIKEMNKKYNEQEHKAIIIHNGVWCGIKSFDK